MNFKIPTEPYWPNSEPDDLYRSSNFTPLVSNSVIETDYPSDNDAMLKFIASLIRQIQALKAENAKLRRSTFSNVKASFNRSNDKQVDQRKLFMCKYFQRGFCKYGKDCKFKHIVPKPTRSFQGKSSELKKAESLNSVKTSNERSMKPCLYCRKRHIYGSSYCQGFGAVCTFCQGRNHLEIACFYKNPNLLLGRRKTPSKNLSKPEKGQSTDSNPNLIVTNSKENKGAGRSDSEIIETNVQMADESCMLKVSQQGEDIENAPDTETLEDLENSSDTSSNSDRMLTENELQILRSFAEGKKSADEIRVEQPVDETDERFLRKISNVDQNQPFSTTNMDRKVKKSHRRRNRRPKRLMGIGDPPKRQAPKLEDKTQEISNNNVKEATQAENGIENTQYDSYYATWLKNVQDIPLELKVLKELVHCKEVIGLTYEKEYKEFKMKIKLLEETLEEGKYKDKENSTSERKKCKDIGL